jgi:hypothetical protein
MFAFLGLELRTLYLDRDEHDREQHLANCRQLESFKTIAQGIETTISSGKQVSSKLDTLNDFIRKPYLVSATPQQRQQRVAATDKTLNNLRAAAAGDQKKYVEAIALKINNSLRSLLARSGSASKLSFDPRINAATLSDIGYLKQNISYAVGQWFNREASLISSVGATANQFAETANDGAKILADVDAVPMASQVVIDSGFPLYADAEGKKQLFGMGVVLDEVAPNGTHSLRVFPTTQGLYYRKNMSVSWEWDIHFLWPQAYYLDKNSGTFKLAFGSSADFVGRDLQQLLVTQ